MSEPGEGVPTRLKARLPRIAAENAERHILTGTCPESARAEAEAAEARHRAGVLAALARSVVIVLGLAPRQALRFFFSQPHVEGAPQLGLQIGCNARAARKWVNLVKAGLRTRRPCLS